MNRIDLINGLPAWYAILALSSFVALTASCSSDDVDSTDSTPMGSASGGSDGSNSGTAGPAVSCPFTDTDGLATLQEGIASAASAADATFFQEGALQTVDDLVCAVLDDPPEPMRFNPGTFECAQAYLCDDRCRIWVMKSEDGSFTLAGDSETECPSYAGFFSLEKVEAMCSPTCDTNEYCNDGVCQCTDGCRQGTVCCGGSLCAGDCVGTPCCT